MKIEIIPLEKVIVDGVKIELGALRTEVEDVIGKGQQSGTRNYYYNTNMAIDYDADNKVEFIEFLGGIDGELHPFIYNVPVFETDADELDRLLRKKNGPRINDLENGYSLDYREISVGVYRETTPKAVQEMIEEMKSLGIPTDNNEDVETELRRACHWSTLGIGIKDYYNR